MAEEQQRHGQIEDVPDDLAVAIDIVEGDRVTTDDDEVLDLGRVAAIEVTDKAPRPLGIRRQQQQPIMVGIVRLEKKSDGEQLALVWLIELADTERDLRIVTQGVNESTTKGTLE